MRHDEITRTITASSPGDCAVLLDGPFFRDRFGEVIEGGQHWLEADSHDYLAVYTRMPTCGSRGASHLATGGSSRTGFPGPAQSHACS